MKEKSLPKDVYDFLENCIDSAEQLRVLALLHSNPMREWNISEISSELRSSESSIQNRLDCLYDRKVLLRSPLTNSHRYSPYNEEVQAVIDRVIQTYEIKTHRVMEIIFSKKSALKAFADAFKVKKKS